MSQRMRQSGVAPPGRAMRGAFTLVELLVVMVIISILLGFILSAAMDGVKRAQERATQTLITKLEMGLSDRLDALLQTRPDPNTAHLALAQIYSGNTAMPGYLRGQVIAWYDYLKREMPDTFFVQNTSGPYPINFAANPYPYSSSPGLANFILPMGHMVPANSTPPGDGFTNAFNQAGAGAYGASYPVAAGLYKNLGYLPAGYDSVDNDGNGLIDDMPEGAPQGSAALTTVQAHLGNHKHITARAEMLYALLVEGRGPLGSVFNADDFTDKEVQDTDDDGLPEFVDAWGNPLQFFRWPLLYHSDIQRGQVIQANSENAWTLLGPYAAIFEQREQDPLDLNQQLVAPAWWSSGYNNNAANYLGSCPGQASNVGGSASVQAFEYYFRRLTEPYPNNGSQPGFFWDRGSTYAGRRAYYSKFLIVSGGLDGQLGVFLYSDTALSSLVAQNTAAQALISNENNAMPFSATDTTSGGFTVDFTSAAQYGSTSFSYTQTVDLTTPSTGDLLQAAQDDISNQNIQSTVGIGGGG
jgi:prepilin-type N-terminal cleavage/methylation domain-containing protein